MTKQTKPYLGFSVVGAPTPYDNNDFAKFLTKKMYEIDKILVLGWVYAWGAS